MKSRNALFLLFSFLASVNLSKSQSPGDLEPFASDLDHPVSIVHAGDNRLFIVSQPGSVIISDSAGNLNPEPFLNISDRVVYGGEQGLLGIAFHEDYKANGYFYVNYTGNGDSTHISRFNAMSGNPDKADPESEFKLLTIAQPFKNHNGGNLIFGPDGYLYIGLGDGGSGGDPGNRAQNHAQLLGKMLRIDVDNGSPYGIPPTNPFNNDTSGRKEIWALGLRNPWKFSFDRLTGDLWIADVGQNLTEEINFQPLNSKGGENYGWRCYEGNGEFDTAGCPPVDSFAFPVYDYPHGEECSVTGGYVYRGDSLSAYYGYYFFADYCSDRIWTLHNESGTWLREDFGRFPDNNFSAFGEDSKGQLYIAGHASGKIYRLIVPPTGLPHVEIPGIKIIQFPGSGKVRIEGTQGFSSGMNIQVYDMRGILQYRDQSQDSVHEFDLNHLPPGIYILSVNANGKNLVKKIFAGR